MLLTSGSWYFIIVSTDNLVLIMIIINLIINLIIIEPVGWFERCTSGRRVPPSHHLDQGLWTLHSDQVGKGTVNIDMHKKHFPLLDKILSIPLT